MSAACLRTVFEGAAHPPTARLWASSRRFSISCKYLIHVTLYPPRSRLLRIQPRRVRKPIVERGRHESSRWQESPVLFVSWTWRLLMIIRVGQGGQDGCRSISALSPGFQIFSCNSRRDRPAAVLATFKPLTNHGNASHVQGLQNSTFWGRNLLLDSWRPRSIQSYTLAGERIRTIRGLRDLIGSKVLWIRYLHENRAPRRRRVGRTGG